MHKVEAWVKESVERYYSDGGSDSYLDHRSAFILHDCQGMPSTFHEVADEVADYLDDTVTAWDMEDLALEDLDGLFRKYNNKVSSKKRADKAVQDMHNSLMSQLAVIADNYK